jgi:uncharacterized protein (DUF1499 family)
MSWPTGIAILLLAVIAAGLGVRLYMDRAAESRLRPGEDVALAELRGVPSRNAFLACPPDYCRSPDAVASPIFAVSADRLYWEFLRLVTSEPRVAILADEPQRRRIALIQRSALFRFPDIVVAEIVAHAPDRAGIAIYSRARYGRYDFGVNRRRIEGWLKRLRGVTPQ